MANRKSESKKQAYKFVYEGINQSDDVLRAYSEEVLETIFTGSTMQVGDTMNNQDISSVMWTTNVTEKYFGRNTSDTNSEFFDTIWGNQQRAYDARMASEWSTFMDGVKEENPGLYQWIQNDLKNADDVAGRKEQINMVYGPWVANERVALSNHVDVNQLSSRVWQQGAINQGKIEQIVRDGIALGEPRHETYQKLNEWLNPDYAPAIFGEDGIVRRLPGNPNASSAARRLMRTETARATGMAEIDASLTIPSIIGTEWALASRHPMYDICDERASDDLYDLGPGIYEPGEVPPYPPHPNCVIGSTSIESPEINTLYRRWYDGDIVEISTQGNENLVITPNHPVLTSRGWVPAGELHEGDYLISSVSTDCSRGPDDQRSQVLSVEQIFESFSTSRSMTTQSVPGTPVDFHGDGVIDEKVDIVRTDSALLSELEPTVFELFSQDILQLTHPELAELSSPGSLNLRSPSVLHSSSRSSSRFSHLHSGLHTHSTHPSLYNLAERSNGSVAELETFTNSSSSDIQGSSDTEFRFSALVHQYNFFNLFLGRQSTKGIFDTHGLEITRNKTFAHAQSVSQLFDSCTTIEELEYVITSLVHSTDLRLVPLVNARHYHYSGYVYNLETAEHWYSANNIIIHNCMCALINVHMDEDDAHLAAVNAARQELGLPPLSESDLNRIADQEWLHETPDFGILNASQLQEHTPEHSTTISPLKTIDETQALTDHYYSEATKRSMEIYQGNTDYPFINTMLRENLTPAETLQYFEDQGVNQSWLNYWHKRLDEDPTYYTKVIQHMDIATNTFTSNTDTTLFRGVMRGDDLSQFEPGMIWTDSGFGSTTFSPEIAEGFARDYMLEIQFPEGQAFGLVPEDRGQWIVDTDAEFGEQEILLPRNTRFRVIDISQGKWDRYPTIRVKIVEDDD